MSPTTKIRAVHLQVPADALDTFDGLAAERGLSRPALFTQLMAVEAQRRRIAADIAVMRGEGPDPESEDVSTWVRASSVSIEEPGPAV